MTRLDNSQFLSQLKDLVLKNQGKSSVYLTQKRLSTEKPHGESLSTDFPTNVIDMDKSLPRNEQKYPILIRVSMNSSNNRDGEGGKKVKISTVVETEQLNQFWQDYIQVIKIGFVGLKKKEKKSKSKKNKIGK
ncbi:hypothetical protein KGF56_001599 [Candida oxycetoniae]|uniref:Signal recognition particle subunit SRP14 n=1 Tax=Candida oxycetoniae TaxID=497107 RepID=A0AAI9SZS2_9ASCO|nr:uncharacterized protein KGF56_001599 [Candida oxycetoniae]KAI3405581.2 hypothetical protein KGF56_001599 [Candida oxycetoniae]